MVASVQNRSRHFSVTIRANVNITGFVFKKEFFKVFFKVLIVQIVKIFDLLVLTFKISNL